jgi:large subunit ribosomal protein L25
MDRIEFQKAYKQAGTSSIISLQTGSGAVRVLVHEVGVDPIRGVPMHVDFRVVDMLHTTHISIPLEFVGEAPGVKTLGASVVKVLHDIEVEAMADKLPHSIQVDISGLVDEDSHITIGDLVLPAGVSMYHTKTDEIVASLSIQREESEDSKTEPEA